MATILATLEGAAAAAADDGGATAAIEGDMRALALDIPGRAYPIVFHSLCVAGHTDEAMRHAQRHEYTLADVRANDNELLYSVCGAGHVDTLHFLLSFGLTREDILAQGARAFRVACENGHHMIIWHLTHACSLTLADVPTEVLREAFYVACASAHEDVVRLLLELGYPLAEVRWGGNRALAVASEHGHVNVAMTLFRAGLTHEDAHATGLTAAFDMWFMWDGIRDDGTDNALQQGINCLAATPDVPIGDAVERLQ